MNNKTIASLASLVLALLVSASAQQPAAHPPLQRTAGSPIAIGTDGTFHVVSGFDLTGDGKEDLVTLGYGPSGTCEVRAVKGDGAGGFTDGGSASLGVVSVNVTEDALAVGAIYADQPGVALIVGGTLRLFKTSPSSGSVLFQSQSAPTFSGATLRSVAVHDLDGDGLADLVLTAQINSGNQPGGVYVMLNSAGGLQAPVPLTQPGSEAGKLAIGDVNGDGKKDIAVVDTAELCVKVYLASTPGAFPGAPVTVNAYGELPEDIRPRAVAIGQIIPGGAEEIVMWNVAEASATGQFLQFGIYEHTGSNAFARATGIGFSELHASSNRYGDIAIGDLNGDGQPDIVGTNPVDDGIAVLAIGLDQNGRVAADLSPVTQYETSNTPDNITLGNPNGDFESGNTPKLDVIVTHGGTTANRTVDVFLNGGSATPLPPGTPGITTSAWPIFGGEFTASGAANPLSYAAIDSQGKKFYALPSGQTLNPGGQLNGVAANGTYTIKIRVSKGKKFSEKTFTFTVNNTAALTPGASAWWPGEDAGADVVGGHTAFTPLDGMEAAYGAGKVGRAFLFDGVDDFLGATNSGDDLDLRGNITIEGWVRPAADSLGIRTIVAKHDAADEDLTFALQMEANGKLSYVARRTADKKATTVTTSKPIPTAAWTHVAARVRGTEISLFVNGALSTTVAVPPTFLPPSTTGQSVTIGATCTAPSGARANFWKGEIDELTIYRRALDDEEIDLVCKVGTAGKDRFDAAREFSTATPPQPNNAPWRYGFIPAGPINPDNFNPADTLTTTDPALDVWQPDGTGVRPAVRRNKSTAAYTDADSAMYAPDQIGQSPGSDGRHSAVRWTAPEAGRYAVAATFKKLRAMGATSNVLIYHKTASLFSGATPATPLGGGTSFTGTITVVAGDTVDFIASTSAQPSVEVSSLFASVVPLPEEFEPVETPEIDDLDFDAPLQTGKLWSFRARQGDSPDHEGRIDVKLQYSATPNEPGSWQDVIGGVFVRSSSLGWRLNISTLPVGNFAFRIATNVVGEGMAFSAPSQLFNIGAATTILDFISREQEVASDPTGATTHRGDLITYRFTVRNAGGLKGSKVSLRALIPDGTKVKSKTKGGAIKVKPAPPFPGAQPINYMVWNLGDLAPAPLDDAKTYELVVQVIEPSLKDDLKPAADLNAPGDQIKQNDYALIAGDFNNPGQIVAGPQPFLSATIVNPITASAAIVDGSPTPRGGLVKVEFTVRNASSVPVKNGTLLVAVPTPPAGYITSPLVLQDGFGSLAFLIDGAESGVAPNDPKTKKPVVLSGFKVNPALSELPDGRQAAFFAFGALEPGAEQKFRASFRVPYDWPLDVPISLDSVQAFLTSPAARILERTLPPVAVPLDATPPAGIPKLVVVTNQSTANTLPDNPGIGAVTTNALGVPNITPKRTSNQITYRAYVVNAGEVAARFLTANVVVPDGTTYRTGSGLLRTSADPTGKTLPDPVRDGNQLFFTVPNLAADSGCYVELGVTVDRTTPLKDDQGNPTLITFTGAVVKSREVLAPGATFEPRVAQLVEPGRMHYTFTRLAGPFTAQTPLVYHTFLFHNAGGVTRSGVGIKYTIPAGLKFHSAFFTDELKKTTPAGGFGGSPITKPAVGATSGDVIFDIGTVKAGKFGFAKVALTPDAANVPTSGPGAYNATADWMAYDSTTDFGNSLRGVRRFAASGETGDGPTTGSVTQPYQDPNAARTFLLVTAPSSISATPPADFTYQVSWGNVSDVAGVGLTTFPIPVGTEIRAASTATNLAGDVLGADFTPGNTDYPEGYVTWGGSLPAHEVYVATVTVRLRPGTLGTITASRGFLGTFTSANRHAQPVSTRIIPAGLPFAPAIVFATGLGTGASAYLGNNGPAGIDAAQELAKVTANSTSMSLVGADNARIKQNGAVIIPIGGGRMVAAGGGNILSNANGALVSENGLGFAIRAGDETSLKVELPGQGATAVGSLISNAGNLYRDGILGLTANGGQNLLRLATLVGNDGGSLIGMDGSTLISNDGSTLGTFGLGANGVSFTPASGAAVAAVKSAALVSIGNGSLITHAAGLVNAGGVNFVGTNGGTLVTDNGAGLIGDNSAGVLTDYGLGVIARDGAGVIARDGASVIARDGASVIARDGASLIGNDSAGVTSAAAGNFLRSGTGVVPTGAGR